MAPKATQSISPIARVECGENDVTVDAALIADALGLEPSSVPVRMREGEITAICERGIDEDSGFYRLTFFRAGYRARLIVDSEGAIRQRTSVNFGYSGSSSPSRQEKP